MVKRQHLALLGAALGVSFHPAARQLRFHRPVLPPFLQEVRIERLCMGGVSVDLLFHRQTRDASLTVLRKEGEAEIIRSTDDAGNGALWLPPHLASR